MLCFGRLVRLLLGSDAVACAKLQHGASLSILGVDVSMSAQGLRCCPTADKARNWLSIIDEALRAQSLTPGLASKLAGKLSWGSSVLFRRLGRAAMRPIFDQQTRRDAAMSPELRRALIWWSRVLRLQIVETRPWHGREPRPVHLFCDARGSLPHLGAVLFAEDGVRFTHATPPDAVANCLRRRRDNQIMGLELLGITLGLCTFEACYRLSASCPVIATRHRRRSPVNQLSFIATTPAPKALSAEGRPCAWITLS